MFVSRCTNEKDIVFGLLGHIHIILVVNKFFVKNVNTYMMRLFSNGLNCYSLSFSGLFGFNKLYGFFGDMNEREGRGEFFLLNSDMYSSPQMGGKYYSIVTSLLE